MLKLNLDSNVKFDYNSNIYLDIDALFTVLKIDQSGNLIFSNITSQSIEYNLTKGDNNELTLLYVPKNKFSFCDQLVIIGVQSNTQKYPKNIIASKIFSNIFNKNEGLCNLYGEVYFTICFDDIENYNDVVGITINDWLNLIKI